MAEKTKSNKTPKATKSQKSDEQKTTGSRVPTAKPTVAALPMSLLDQVSRNVQNQLPKAVLEHLSVQSSVVKVSKKWLQDSESTNPLTVEIRVIKSKLKAGFEVTVRPAKLPVSAAEKHEVRWTCPDGDLEIRFNCVFRPIVNTNCGST